MLAEKKQLISSAASACSPRVRSGFFKFHQAMEEAGFGLARHEFQKGLLIYDRGLDSDGIPNGKSCYSVFAWLGKGSMLLRFQNPDSSPSAFFLLPHQISNLHIETLFTSYSIERLVAKIKENSAKKPPHHYFLALHDHIRYVDGSDLAAMNFDDGLSDWKTMILHKKGENIDFDFGSSCHNHFPLEQMKAIGQLEGILGISKGASVELTMPFSKKSTNGPHHLLWFSSFEAAKEYHDKFLSKRIYKYPAYAPDASPKRLKKENQRLRQEGLLAVGIAHPASGLRLPVFGVPPVGLLDMAAEGIYPLDYVFGYVSEYADSVAGFNSLAGKDIRKFANPSEGRRMLELVEKWGAGGNLFPNALNMAFSLEMKSRFGTAVHADNDTHNFHLFRFKHTIHGYGKIRTVLDASILPSFSQGSKPTVQQVVEAFRLPGIRAAIIPFIPYSPAEADIAKARRNEALLQKAEDFASELWFHLTSTIPKVLSDVKTRLAGLFH
ncbi:MAG: hypothetical protein N3F07_01560 [Candidatus Micrarchaeota archaeon]|nr:hypothetical protein [Candidatus Micrarchaeota archaeon]